MSMFFDQPIWVLHPERPQGPQWRQCRMRLETSESRHQTTMTLSVRVRQCLAGDNLNTLFNSMGFRACLDKALHGAIGHLYHDRDTIPPGEHTPVLFFAQSRGAGQKTPRHSPTLTFTMGSCYAVPVHHTSHHARIDIARRMAQVAADNAALRAQTFAHIIA